MTFSSREEGGRELGRRLLERGIKPDIVLGLPRGGVVVAAEVAKMLQCPLDVLAVRKIGHPRQREFAVGALAEPDIVLLDVAVTGKAQISCKDLQEIIAEETARLRDYQAKFHQGGAVTLEGRTVLVVDDGLATGATAEAAVVSAGKQKAARIIVATPVSSPDAVARLSPVADELIAVVVDPDFAAVGQHYAVFPQATNEEVLALLNHHA